MKFDRVRAYFNNFFWLFLTYLLAPYFYFQIFFENPSTWLRARENAPLKILVIQIGKIGDLVCTTPVFREIKRKFPSAHLTTLILSKTSGILKNNPRVDEIIFITDYVDISGKLRLFNKLRKEKYDWAINIFPHSFANIISFWSLIPNRVATTHKYSGEIIWLLSIFNNYRLEYKRHTQPMKHFLNLLKFIGICEYSEARELFITPEEEKKASDFLKANTLGREDLLIGMSVTAGIKIKEWIPDKFASLADKLIEEKNAKVIFIGSADDRSRIAEIQRMMQNTSINTAGLFTLAELPALLKKLKLFISVDTGPLNMAAALDIPVVDIAGPVNVKDLYPLNTCSRIVQKNLYCVPCLFMLYGSHFCKEGHLRCLREITSQDVFNAAVELIHENINNL